MQQYVVYRKKKRQGPAPTLTPGNQYLVLEEREDRDGKMVLIVNDRGAKKWYYRDAFDEVKPEGPWEVKYMGSASSTEAGTEYEDWIEITDGNVTLYFKGGASDDDEQKLVNLLNALKIKLDYDHGAELLCSQLEGMNKERDEFLSDLRKELDPEAPNCAWTIDDYLKAAKDKYTAQLQQADPSKLAMAFARYLEDWDIHRNPTEADRWYGYGKKGAPLERHYEEFLKTYQPENGLPDQQ